MSLLLSLQRPFSSWELRVLFFPTGDNIESGGLNSNHLRLPICEETGKQFPLLQFPPVTTEKMRVQMRRPKFLEALPLGRYIQVFEKHVNNHTETIISWDTLSKLFKQTGEPMRQLLRHDAFWYDPRFRYPSAASKALRQFTWDKAIKQLVLESSALQEGMQRPIAEMIATMRLLR